MRSRKWGSSPDLSPLTSAALLLLPCKSVVRSRCPTALSDRGRGTPPSAITSRSGVTVHWTLLFDVLAVTRCRWYPDHRGNASFSQLAGGLRSGPGAPG